MGELLGVQLQPREIAELCYEAGWQDAMDLVVAVAVCLAESQGYTRAINVNPNGTKDRGMWQLNSIHEAYTDDLAYDKRRATAAAHSLWRGRGGGFEDWAAFNTGVYLHDSYIGRAAVGVANFLGERLLQKPVPDWADEPYVHHFVTPIADFRFRVGELAAASLHVTKLLGYRAATAARVAEVQKILGLSRGVVHRIRP